MNAPEINISFIEKANKSFQIANRGIVALMIGAKPIDNLSNPFTVVTEADIPESGLSDTEVDQIKLALKGYEGTSPAKVIVYCMDKPVQYTETYLNTLTLDQLKAIETEYGYTVPSGDTLSTHIQNILTKQVTKIAPAYEAALAAMFNVKFNYIVFTTLANDASVATLASTIIDWIDERGESFRSKVILHGTANSYNNEHVIVNYSGATVAETVSQGGVDTVVETEYTNDQFCARIAGLLAATPVERSATYAVIEEAVACTTPDDLDAAVDDGLFFLMFDGEKVKVCRAVNSFTTTTETKGESFKKIRIVDIMDTIYNDIRGLTEDQYIGKYPNTYDNKNILITSIDEYLNELTRHNMINGHTVEIDVNAQREYLKEAGKPVEEMAENEIKEANTGSKVFLTGTINILDAIEDIDWTIYI